MLDRSHPAPRRASLLVLLLTCAFFLSLGACRWAGVEKDAAPTVACDVRLSLTVGGVT